MEILGLLIVVVLFVAFAYLTTRKGRYTPPRDEPDYGEPDLFPYERPVYEPPAVRKPGPAAEEPVVLPVEDKEDLFEEEDTEEEEDLKPVLSSTNSKLWIVNDTPFLPGDSGFNTGEGMTLLVLAADQQGRAVAGVSVRGIIDSTDGSDLETFPRTAKTNDEGVARFRYHMRSEDQIVQGSKLINAILIDPVTGGTVIPKPAVLWDDLLGT